MNLIRQLIALSVLVLAASQPSLAVQVSNQMASSPASANATGFLERGGTIDAVDPAKRTMVVDKVKYPFSAMPVKIHAPAGTSNDKAFQLKAGMQIRFNTSKSNYAVQEQVQEIWVTSVGKNPLKK